MRITVDTAHDSHDDVRKVIRMLQHLVGDNQEIFTNQPQETASPMANIFGDTPSITASGTTETAQETTQETSQETTKTTESTEDLFAELFSEDELKKMDSVKSKEEEEDEEEETKPKAKDKKYGIELY